MLHSLFGLLYIARIGFRRFLGKAMKKNDPLS
jgi:hypothetical protein